MKKKKKFTHANFNRKQINISVTKENIFAFGSFHKKKIIFAEFVEKKLLNSLFNEKNFSFDLFQHENFCEYIFGKFEIVHNDANNETMLKKSNFTSVKSIFHLNYFTNKNSSLHTQMSDCSANIFKVSTEREEEFFPHSLFLFEWKIARFSSSFSFNWLHWIFLLILKWTTYTRQFKFKI